jgi:hypothetical protein
VDGLAGSDRRKTRKPRDDGGPFKRRAEREELKMNRWLNRFAAFFALGCVSLHTASAAVITLDPIERGFITQTGATNPPNPNALPGQADYLLGNCAMTSCPFEGGGEFRDFFGFAIPIIDGTIASVELMIDTAYVDLSQSPLLTALFTSLDTTGSFAALGTGTPYGSISYGASDAHTRQGAMLNQSALNAILADQSGVFRIGDRAITAADLGPAFANQWVYGHTGLGDLTQLVITTNQVPEPSGIALVGAGMLGLLCICGFLANRSRCGSVASAGFA